MVALKCMNYFFISHLAFIYTNHDLFIKGDVKKQTATAYVVKLDFCIFSIRCVESI